LKDTNNVDTGLCLIALPVLLVLSMMKLVDYNNEMVINFVYGAFANFFIS